jgi:hypothetical protein
MRLPNTNKFTKYLLFGLLLFILLLFIYLISSENTRSTNGDKSFSIMELEIPKELFPENAIMNEMAPLSEDEGAMDDGMQSVYWNGGNGISVLQAFQFASINAANEKYQFYLSQMEDSKTKKPWATTLNITFVSERATEMKILCGNYSQFRCGYVAQYQKYLVFLNSTIDDNMTYSDFAQIIEYIDKKFSEDVIQKE